MPFDRVERLLTPDYLVDLPSRPLQEVRSKRAECQDVEVGLSYLRRLVQGRIDIVAAGLAKRAESGAPIDLADLVEQLPSILGEHTRSPGVGRLPTLMAPSEEVESELRAELDAIADADCLAELPTLPNDEVRSLVESLVAFERKVSSLRRALHERLDALQAELTSRYKTGEASVDSLLS